MIIAIEVILFFTGFAAVITGRFPLRRNSVCRGLGARFAGMVLMLPMPLTLAVVESWGGPGGGTFGRVNFVSKALFLEIGLLVGCTIAGYLIAVLTFNPFAELERGRREKALQKRIRRARRARRDDADDDIPAGQRSGPGINPWIPIGIGAGVLGIVLMVVVIVVVLSRNNTAPAQDVGEDLPPRRRPMKPRIAPNYLPAQGVDVELPVNPRKRPGQKLVPLSQPGPIPSWQPLRPR